MKPCYNGIVMGYRFVFSQMFDVRPRRESGDLDLEKIKKLEAILNLKIGEKTETSERIIDLRPAQSLEKIRLIVRGEASEESFLPRPNKKIKQAKISFDWSQPLEISHPRAEDIYSVFEAVEEIERSLKNEELVIENEPLEEESVKDAEQDEIESVDFMPSLADDVEIKIAPISEEPIAASQVLVKDDFISEKFGAKQETAVPPQLILADNKELDLQDSQILGFSEQNLIQEEILPGAKRKAAVIFLMAAFLVFSFVPLLGWINGVLAAKGSVMQSGMAAYNSLILAKESLAKADFSAAGKNFETAHQYFAAADSQISKTAGWLIPLLDKIPAFSFVSSRVRLVKAGQDMSKAGEEFMAIVGLFGNNDINLSFVGQNQAPLSDILKEARDRLQSGLESLVSARNNLEKIKISSLPQEMQPQLVLVSQKMPQAIQAAAIALDWSDKFLEILGHQSAKKYLLIFQNNSEMRATGGFIGTYGVLDLDKGKVANLFIDGVFNPDGQLREKIIPPRPIQKISTSWSMHDANRFADFPASAQKIMWFYEKTGGPTVDGVISLTPTVIERLLSLTGPIDMPEYGVSLSVENFVDLIQQEVEADYDKELNQPKKILADFAPKFIERVSQEMKQNGLEVVKIINQSFKEKHVLVYLSKPELQSFVAGQSWAGNLLESSGDYFSVVNSNINGYKTDRVVKEEIKYISQIEEDGTVIDTLEIYRHHQGGNMAYEWFNRVNADYLRLYLPKGSELVSAQGQTIEVYEPPIDYQQAGFKPDSEVLAVEQSQQVDERSGTQIFEEGGKTVFGNWTYISPGETMALTYQYRLPFKIDVLKEDIGFSVLAQKQLGSVGSELEIEIRFPQSWQINGSNLANLTTEGNIIKWSGDLKEDKRMEFFFKR